MLTEEQLEKRKSYITGSDCAAILGISPWLNAIDLWKQKVGLMEAEDISDKPVVKAGNYLEPVVAQWFVDETGKNVHDEPNMIISRTYPFMAGNIDRRITNENAILECKTASRDIGWGSDGDNSIPDYYLCQVAHYAAVCDVDRAYIAVLIRGSDFRWYTYDRNPKLEEIIIAKEKAFWECVVTQEPPEPRTAEEIISLYTQAEGDEPVVADQYIEECIDRIFSLRSQIAERQTEQDQLEALIKSHMKDKSTLISAHRSIKLATWNNVKGRTTFDAKAFAKDNPELYEKYLKTGAPTRRFSLK